jgi:NhaP-type Na+/H+ or K+/H+ antiporter
MALSGSVLRRLPLTASMFYLAGGFGLGPVALNLIALDPIADVMILERVTEVAVLISLFAAGLKLRVPLSNWRWLLPVGLAFGSMVVTVGLVTLVGVFGLGLPLGAAVLLGAILAPTDPVLASDVQVTDPLDRDRLRFVLTSEAGLNDGTAFPFVMLGLGLLGLHDLGDWGWKWASVDLLWAVTAGLGCGWAVGYGVGRLVLYLRQRHRVAVGSDVIGGWEGEALLERVCIS